MQAATNSHFEKFTIANSSHSNIQPDISFNTYSSDFMVTYFDSTDHKLPFLTNNLDLTTPNTWNIVSNGYNDSNIFTSPYPKVRMNYGQLEGMNVWSSEGLSSNRIALFDAPYSTYTSLIQEKYLPQSGSLKVYPNPSNQVISISFNIYEAEMVSIELCNLLGQPFEKITNQFYCAGNHVVQYEVSKLHSGNYMIIFVSNNYRIRKIISVIH